jgi:hypothetical protein
MDETVVTSSKRVGFPLQLSVEASVAEERGAMLCVVCSGSRCRRRE